MLPEFCKFSLITLSPHAFLQSSLRCLVRKDLATRRCPSSMQGGRRVAVCQEKHMCRNAFCGFQVRKATCLLLCSGTVGKALFLFRNTDCWGWVLFSYIGRVTDSSRSCIPMKLSIYLGCSMVLKDSGTERFWYCTSSFGLFFQIGFLPAGHTFSF